MSNYITFSKLTDEEQNYWLDRVVVMKLQHYIRNFIKMTKAGVTPLEVVQLRGLPLTKDEIKERLISGKIIINSLDDDTTEIIEPKHKNK